MSFLLMLLAGFFLPLFPLSMVFNALLGRIKNPIARVLLIFIWPQIGVFLLAWAGLPLDSGFFVGWAVLTAVFYAWRLLTVRVLSQWAGMLATSAWALAWIIAADLPASSELHSFALWMSVAPALLIFIAIALQERFGAAYSGLVVGLARALPRLSSVIVIVVLAAMALPIFPSFFAMLVLLAHSSILFALPILLTWLLWSWAGTRLLNGFVFGPRAETDAADLSSTTTWGFVGLIAAIVVINLIWTGA
jgi:NADH:ubiquinone oxidoreductase subunit 4 (subunit M)